MKKVLIVVFAFLCFLPISIFAEEKVKVYMFESGGCPYCEMELEYLENLETYNTEFEIVRKELYIDHVDWEPGADYNLGVEVADVFNAAGYKDASYTGTPFVIISDIYAAAAYNADLENVIHQAYVEGDMDAVSCIQNGGSDCVRPINNNTSDIDGNGKAIAILAVVALVVVVVYIIKLKKPNVEEEKNLEIVDELIDKEEAKPVTKRTNKVKSDSIKKSTKKSTKKEKNTMKMSLVI